MLAKIKTIELSSLVPVRKVRRPSAKQIALQRREDEYSRAISKLEKGQALSFEPSDGEKTPAIRASISRVISRHERRADLHLAVIGNVIYVAAEPIPGARKARRPKSAGPAE